MKFDKYKCKQANVTRVKDMEVVVNHKLAVSNNTIFI